MNRPMRLVSKSETTEICSEIGLHKRCFLCDLSGDSLRDFDAISLAGFYPGAQSYLSKGNVPKECLFFAVAARSYALVRAMANHLCESLNRERFWV
jgi:hypothetical protein